MDGVLVCEVLRWDYRWEGCYVWSAGVWRAKVGLQVGRVLWMECWCVEC